MSTQCATPEPRGRTLSTLDKIIIWVSLTAGILFLLLGLLAKTGKLAFIGLAFLALAWAQAKSVKIGTARREMGKPSSVPVISSEISAALRMIVHRAQFSALFFIPGYVLVRVDEAKAAQYGSQRMPGIMILAFAFGLLLAVIGLVYWIRTCFSIYRVITAMHASGQQEGWSFLVLSIALGPAGAWLSAIHYQIKFKRSNR